MLKRRTVISIEEKYKIIKRIEEKTATQQQIADEIGIPQSTIARWVTGEREKIIDHYQSNIVDSSRKRIRTSKYENIKKALFD